jgi:enoyl-CoA hydratase/carnithine racemase
MRKAARAGHSARPLESRALAEERMAYQTIRLEREDGIATLTLHRPEQLNAWNDAMEEELDAALRACDLDDAVRCVVITGAGRAFCAGADLSAGSDRFRGRPAQPPARLAPWDVRKPVVAAVNGHAIGVGLSFALACDLRFVAEDAKLAFAFVRRGVLPGFGSHAIAARVAGLSNAADWMLSGRTFSGREAAERGLATRALPAPEVLPAARAWARDVAAAAPVPVAISKQLLWQAVGAGPMKAREERLFAWCGDQADAREGVEAFLAKREPRWAGRPSSGLPSVD